MIFNIIKVWQLRTQLVIGCTSTTAKELKGELKHTEIVVNKSLLLFREQEKANQELDCRQLLPQKLRLTLKP